MSVEVRRVEVPPGKNIEEFESGLRSQVDFGESGSLPWDNTRLPGLGQRLGRPGQGTPHASRSRPERDLGVHWNKDGELVYKDGKTPVVFDPADTPDVSTVRLLIQESRGDIDDAAASAGVRATTMFKWLRDNGLRARDFE